MYTFRNKADARTQATLTLLGGVLDGTIRVAQTDHTTDAKEEEFLAQVVQEYVIDAGASRYYICTERVEANDIYQLIGKLEANADDYAENFWALASEMLSNPEAYVWIDLDSGTILNGPVVQVPESLITEDMGDSEVIAAATEYLNR